MSEANSKQIDGAHYRPDDGCAERAAELGVPAIQHWDFTYIRGYNGIQYAASKYLDRYDKKGDPIVNLQKAAHCIQKLIEIEEGKQRIREEREALAQQNQVRGRARVTNK